MTTFKWVEDNYSYSEILDKGPKTKKVSDTMNIHSFNNVQEVLDHFPDIDPKNISITCGFYEYGGDFEVEREVPVTELQRYKIGKKILRDEEKRRVVKKTREEKELKELERLKKKYEGKTNETIKGK
jgi:hypothetical protein